MYNSVRFPQKRSRSCSHPPSLTAVPLHLPMPPRWAETMQPCPGLLNKTFWRPGRCWHASCFKYAKFTASQIITLLAILLKMVPLLMFSSSGLWLNGCLVVSLFRPSEVSGSVRQTTYMSQILFCHLRTIIVNMLDEDIWNSSVQNWEKLPRVVIWRWRSGGVKTLNGQWNYNK